MANVFKRGALVAVINCTMGGRYIVESNKARIVRRLDDDCSYLVDIGGDQVARFLDAAAQADPYGYVAKLNATAARAAQL